MKVTFIVAPYNIIADCYGSEKSKTGEADYGYWMPLGIGFLASSAIEAGHKAEIIDCAPNGYSYEDVKRILNRSKPDAIGVSANIAISSQSKSLIESLKDDFEVPIFMGGNLATTLPHKTLENNPHLSFILRGEAEKTIPEVLDKLEQSKTLKDIPGIGYRENGNIIVTDPRKPVSNLDELSPPAWHLYDIHIYKPLPLQVTKIPVVPYLTSRGCSYGRCTFCFDSGIAAPKYRRHSVDRVISDIKILVEKHKIKEVAFWDDIFFINQDWVLDFCKKLKQEKIDIPWQGYAYINTLTKKMVEVASKSGCWNIAIGYESGNQEVLNRVKKATNLEDIKKKTKIIHDNGITTRGFFVVGLPGDTPERTMESSQLAIDMDLTFAQFNTFYPEYGTEDYFDAVKKGMISEDYITRTGAVYVPEGYKDAKEVSKTARLAYKKFYIRPKYFLKHGLRALTHPSTIPSYSEGLRYILGMAFNKKNY
ncbi:MAG: cobalamin-dependent protein [Nanoarchaeota archaeon]|nr:cobalamin-dependent protein [Nanoarchaeota archaeon]